jgi:hypothetical protein
VLAVTSRRCAALKPHPVARRQFSLVRKDYWCFLLCGLSTESDSENEYGSIPSVRAL